MSDDYHFEVVKVTDLPNGEQYATTVATVIETTIRDVRDNTGVASQKIKDRAWVEVSDE